MSKPEAIPANVDAGPQKKAYSASSWEIHKWGMGAIAHYWMYCQFSFIMMVYTTGFKLDPRYVGVALFFPRIIDGLIDPFIGHLSDNTHTRWGRRRPFLFFTTIIGACLVVAIWMPSTAWPQWIQCVWLTLGAILLFSTWGIYDMAYSSMGYELSDDYNDRSRVFAIRGVYAATAANFGGFYYSAAMLLGQGVHWPLKLGPWEWTLTIPSLGNEINGIRALSLFAAGMVLFFGFIPVFFCKERFVNANRKHVSLWKAFGATLQCRPFVLLLLLKIIRGLGGVSGALVGYLGIYYVCRGDKFQYMTAMAGLGGVIGWAFSMAAWPLAKPLTKHLGKKWGLILSFGFAFLNVILSPFITWPGYIYLSVCVGVAFIFPGIIQELFISSLMPDICDIDELSSGERREGLFASIASFVNKLENSICACLSMWLLSYSGFNPNLAHQAPEVISRWFLWGFTPGIICSAIALFLVCFMPVTEEMMKDVRAKLEIRRREAATVASRGQSIHFAG